MGGPTPLGYDVKDKHLIINDAETSTVRQLFDLYLEIKSVRKLKEEADALGIVTKHRRLKDGRLQGGKPFSRSNLYQLLSNPLYIGRVRHHEETYPGQHKRIINQKTWLAVQELMSSNAANRTSATNAPSPGILTGLIFDETGDRLSPSHANKDGIRYCYYISHRLMQSRRRHEDGWRLPAKEIETPVIDIIHQCLSDKLWLIEMLNIKDRSPRKHQEIFKAANQHAIQIKSGNPTEQRKLLRNTLSRVELHPDKLIIELDIEKLGNILQPDVITTTHASATPMIHRIEVPHKLKKRGIEAKLVIGHDASPRQDRDPHLILLIAKAHRWLNDLTIGNATSIHELAERLNEDRGEISRFLPLAFLAPDITDRILKGKQPVDMTIKKLRNLQPLPYSWEEQRQLLGSELINYYLIQ